MIYKTKTKTESKIVAFYQALPDKIVSKIVSDFDLNKKEKRKILKRRSNEKINVLISSYSLEELIYTSYNVIQDKVNLALNEATYEKIILSINEQNKYYSTIFLIRWFYEKNVDEITSEQKYLDDFTNSELFDAIISGESVNNPELKQKLLQDSFSNTDDTANNQEHISEIQSEYTENKNQDEAGEEQSVNIIYQNNNEKREYVSYDNTSGKFAEKNDNTADYANDKNKIKLLGRIEKRTTFFNFFPQFRISEGYIEEIPHYQLETTYPTSGGINLSYVQYGVSEKFLQNDIKADLDKDLYVSTIYVVEIDQNDIEENNNDLYKCKLDLQKLVNNGRNLGRLIYDAVEIGLYKVVTCKANYNLKDGLAGKIIHLNGENIIEGEQVMLFYDNKYFGPFNVNFRPSVNGNSLIEPSFYIKTDISDNNYILPYYPAGDLKVIEFEKQAYFENPNYTVYVYVKNGTKPLYYDVISDQVLLETLVEDIPLELAKTNPEEFVRLCNNSPYLTNLPEGLMEARINRLKLIIDKTELYKEEKRKIFETLLKVYQGQTSEVSDNMVIDSDQYRDLETKFSEERRKNDDAEKRIQELINDKAMLEAELEKIKDHEVTAEKVSQYKAEVEQLKQEAEKITPLLDINSSVEELKKEKEKLEKEKNNLESKNEYLRNQVYTYKMKMETVQNEVSEAIKTGMKNAASYAFDPYISNRLLKEAAAWDTEEEIDYYMECQKKLSEINPSKLCGSALVDYIVNYVQARRKYGKNDIINIYVSVAQNLITIFSGEPGTGKTSMCNIISDTLGLMNFGDDCNRFVSVSVERGWSSKRDLIGYFNPLTRKYDKSNSKIYDALCVLDMEKNDSKYPYLIMLDEANLSPIEYYWADFMRLTDRTSENDCYINIGTEKEVFVPETLRFIATINTDQTTEILSPRLIDRACIVKLPNVEPIKQQETDTQALEIVSWDNFIKTFSKDSELLSATQKSLKEIYVLFNKYGMSVSPRTQLGIEKYVKAAQEIMEEEPGVLPREKAIDFAVVQKLLPKINGYYSNYKFFFDELKKCCKDYHLKMTGEAIDKMIEAQEQNMGYCQYLI